MLLAQDGHNRSEKVVNALKQGIIDGAILSPRYQTADVLAESVKVLLTQFQEKTFFLDPTFYVSTLQATRTGKLETYPYFEAKLGRKDFGPRDIQKYVKTVIDYQISLGLTYIVSPGVIVPSFTSAMAQIALQLFIESAEYLHSVSPDSKLLLCLPIGESALREDEQMSDFLDVLTTIETHGFYIFVERATMNVPQWSDPTTLSGLLYLTHTLSENGFKVFSGYTDIVGVLLSAVGATGIANGWYRNLCSYTSDRFFDQPPRRRGRDIYSSKNLLNSIFIDPELQAITELGFGDDVLTNTTVDNILSKDPIAQAWPQNMAIHHQWETIKSLLEDIETKVTVEEKISLLMEKIEYAQSIYTRLRAEGIEFEVISGPSHLRVWQESLTLFEQMSV